MDLDLRCNYNCFYCWANHDEKGPDIPMDLDLLEELLPYLNKNCWHIYLSCAGEPLIHPRFTEIMDLVKREVTTSDATIITNGWALNEKNSKSIIDAGITSVAVSIDTTDSVLYNRITGLEKADSVGRVMNNVEEFIRLRGKRKYPRVIINAVVMKSTITHLQQLAEWICSAGADGLRLLWFLPQSQHIQDEEYISPDAPESAVIIRSVKKTIRSNGKFFDYPHLKSFGKVSTVLSGLSINKNKSEYLIYAFRKFWTAVVSSKCRLKGLSIFINRSGSFFMCPDSYQSLGDIAAIKDVDLHKQVTRKTKQYGKNICIDCKYHNSMLLLKQTDKQE